MTTAARIDELRKKFDENPRRYFAPLANELRKAGELPQAIALCREHLPKQPGHMSGYIVFGQALFESGELGEARAVFEQALALDPENLIALRHLGDIARRQGDPVLARRWYERVLDADPRNDDIAAQLATLATPAVPMPAVAASSTPTPAYAVPPIMLGTLPTPDAAMRAVDIGAIPLRAPEPLPLLDLDAIEAVGDATEAASEASSDMAVAEFEAPASAAVDEVIETPVAEAVAMSVAPIDEASEDTVAAPEDDPFAFAAMPSSGSPESDVDAVVDVDAEFEEGLAAPEWPDTASLVARLGTPRSVTPVAVDIPVEAVEAFGREPQDPVVAPAVAPAPEPIESVATDVVDAPVAEVVDAPVSDEIDAVPEEAVLETAVDTSAAIDGVTEIDVELEMASAPVAEAAAYQAFADHEVDGVEAPQAAAPDADVFEAAAPEADLFEAAAPEATAFASEEVDTDVFTADATETEVSSAADEVEEMVTSAADDDDLPWLAASPEASATSDEVTEFAEALEADARAHGEADEVAVEDRSAWEATPIEASFADVMPEADDDEMDALAAAGSEADASPAFVTETMAELFVAQGLTGQAVSVYEELVRRRPYDPVLSSRLAELHEMLAPAPVAATAPVLPEFTARERFARLAARRAVRGTPARPAHAIDAPGDESLSALFGTEPMPQEDAAARTLAAAFAPVTDEPDAAMGASLFSATPAAGVARQHTPLRPMTPLRAATPIASPAVPSGGDFSFDRFFPDPATATRPPVPGSDETGGRETPSAGAPSASDDLSQFSAWLKGLGNS